MPYINERKRKLAANRVQGAGELTYYLTRFLAIYLEDNGLDFAHLAECVAALECTKLELYRRVGAPYEDKKCKENGDVYPAGILTKYLDGAQ